MDVLMEFIGKLGRYKIIETEDKTKTLWSEYFDEACHNLSGAYKETVYNYIQGCQIPDQINLNQNVHVLDVGFGLGIGLKAFIDVLRKENDTSSSGSMNHSYVSMELDEDLFLWSIKTNFPESIFIKIDNYYTCTFNFKANSHLHTIIFIGDGRITIPEAFKNNLFQKFTAIFQDAFSPKKNPTLWTTEWFLDLKKMAESQVYMSTYSASVSVRKSMIKAGWKISNAKGFGQKRTMTKARLIGDTDALLSAELSKSPTLELHDI
jgi:tRNA U34 5-methylaminomethyl-2-thiouridine-forming methyltransferase MnmC